MLRREIFFQRLGHISQHITDLKITLLQPYIWPLRFYMFDILLKQNQLVVHDKSTYQTTIGTTHSS